ncbi:MAG TPA: hypothetical protein VNO33_20445 [Kofleriaceae bacterium]|nr:hypothetical protein [Kofleriaceae bacterium]
MHRPRLFSHRSCLPLVIALASAGCVATEAEPELTTAESACRACVSPPLVNWVRGGSDPDHLFPRDVEHLHVLLTPAEDDRSFFAWGVGGGEALWLYRVQMGDKENLDGAIAGAAMAHHDAGLRSVVSSGGYWKGEPRPPAPGPIGDPPFSPEFVGIVVDSAAQYEQLTTDTLDQLTGL